MQKNKSVERHFLRGHRILNDVALYLVARFGGAALQLLLLVYLTHRLNPTSYGQLALFTAAYSFTTVLFFNPWRHTIVRFLPTAEGRLPAFFYSISIGVAATILIWGTTLGVANLLGWPPHFYPYALFVAVILGGWTEINLELHRRQIAPLKYMKLFLTRSVLQLTCVATATWSIDEVWAPIAGLVVSHVATMIAVPWRTWRSSPLKTDATLEQAVKRLQPWLVYALPLAVAELVGSALSYTDRIMIASELDVARTGLYAAVHDLTWMGLHVVSLVAYLAFFPRAVQADGIGDTKTRDENLTDGLTLLFGLSAAATVGFASLAEPISQIILGEEYRAGAVQLVGIIAVSHLMFVMKVYWADLSFSLSKRTLPVLLIGVLSLVTNVILNKVMIPIFGAPGAAMATGLVFFVGFILSVGTARVLQVARHPVCWRDLFVVVIAASVMGVVLSALPTASTLGQLFLYILAGLIIFLGTLLMFGLSMFTGYSKWFGK